MKIARCVAFHSIPSKEEAVRLFDDIVSDEFFDEIRGTVSDVLFERNAK